MRPARNTWALAGLFEFEEFEEDFENCSDPTLRVAADSIASHIPPAVYRALVLGT